VRSAGCEPSGAVKSGPPAGVRRSPAGAGTAAASVRAWAGAARF